jgi:hypothetical protein|tara:strand:+ start:40 stop:2067 length:2028 start_codon:yes stop_codon:yes gene_type:complete
VVAGIAKLLLQKNLPKLGNYLRNPSKIPLLGARDKVKAREFYREMGMPDTTQSELMRKGLTATGGLAMIDFFSDDLTRVQEDTVIDPKDYPTKFGKGPVDQYPTVVKQPKVIPLPKKDETGNKKLEDEEKKLESETAGTGNNKGGANAATLAATNSNATSSIGSDAVDRVKAYKDIVRQFLGTGDKGMQMQKGALLMQVGGMLMAGKSDDPGVKGFVDIIGQTAMQTAPMLFQMGVEQGKSEREIGQAALQLYMQEAEKGDRSGDFVSVWDNMYKRGEDGEILYDRVTGAPIVGERKLVSQFRANSPEMDWFLDQNNTLGYGRYTFQPASGTQAGMFGSMGQPGSGALTSDAARDSMKEFAGFEMRGLKGMAQNIIPMMIENRNSLIGYKGRIGQIFGGPAYITTDLMGGFLQEFGDNSIRPSGKDTFVVDRNSDLGKYYQQLLGEGPKGAQAENANMTAAVMEEANETIEMNGEQVGMYRDDTNKYGKGEGAIFFTKGTLSKMLFDPRKSQLEIFETTLGLMLARNRQPTGRMLADVLRRSFREVETASLLDYASNDPRAVIGKYMSIYKELYTNMSLALNMAGVVATEAERGPGLEWAPNSFLVPGAQNLANQYYGLRQMDPSYSTLGVDVPGMGIPSFSEWSAGNMGTVTQDNVITNQNSQSAFDYWNNIFD